MEELYNQVLQWLKAPVILPSRDQIEFKKSLAKPSAFDSYWKIFQILHKQGLLTYETFEVIISQPIDHRHAELLTLLSHYDFFHKINLALLFSLNNACILQEFLKVLNEQELLTHRNYKKIIKNIDNIEKINDVLRRLGSNLSACQITLRNLDDISLLHKILTLVTVEEIQHACPKILTTSNTNYLTMVAKIVAFFDATPEELSVEKLSFLLDCSFPLIMAEALQKLKFNKYVKATLHLSRKESVNLSTDLEVRELLKKAGENAVYLADVIVLLSQHNLFNPKMADVLKHHSKYMAHISQILKNLVSIYYQPLNPFLIHFVLLALNEDYFKTVPLPIWQTSDNKIQKENCQIALKTLNPIDHPFAELLLAQLYAGSLFNNGVPFELINPEKAMYYFCKVLKSAKPDSIWFRRALEDLYSFLGGEQQVVEVNLVVDPDDVKLSIKPNPGFFIKIPNVGSFTNIEEARTALLEKLKQTVTTFNPSPLIEAQERVGSHLTFWKSATLAVPRHDISMVARAASPT